MMAEHWRGTLTRLGDSFERIAVLSRGLYHVMVETRRSETTLHKLTKPPLPCADERDVSNWMQKENSLPSEPSRFREVTVEEAAAIANVDHEKYVCDLQGRPRAVFERGVTRWGYLNGFRDAARQFDMVAGAAGRVFRAMPSDVAASLPVDIAKLTGLQRRGLRRLVFGEVPDVRIPWMHAGWEVAYKPFERGVVIDYTEVATGGTDGASLWLILLHVLGWHGSENSLFRARRWFWHEHTRVDYHMFQSGVHEKWEDGASIPNDRFYSAFDDDGNSHLDICWVSRWAVDQLLAMTEQGFRATEQVRQDLKRLDDAESSNDKGRALELLVRHLFESVHGFHVRECNARTETEEIDLVIDNRRQDPPWDREQAIVLVECKNWSKPTGKNEILSFKSKIENRRGRCSIGIFVAWNGFAETVEKELLRSSHESWTIILLDGAAVQDAVRSGTFVRLLEEKWYESIMR